MLKCLNSLKEYVPRHLRLGRVCDSEPFENVQDIVEQIPVVDERGSVIKTYTAIKRVPAFEAMSKFKASAFRLSALVKAGVPLNVVNINESNSVTIDKLARICNTLDSADKFVEKVIAQRKERDSWFTDEIDNSQNVESKN